MQAWIRKQFIGESEEQLDDLFSSEQCFEAHEDLGEKFRLNNFDLIAWEYVIGN